MSLDYDLDDLNTMGTVLTKSDSIHLNGDVNCNTDHSQYPLSADNRKDINSRMIEGFIRRSLEIRDDTVSNDSGNDGAVGDYLVDDIDLNTEQMDGEVLSKRVNGSGRERDDATSVSLFRSEYGSYQTLNDLDAPEETNTVIREIDQLLSQSDDYFIVSPYIRSRQHPFDGQHMVTTVSTHLNYNSPNFATPPAFFLLFSTSTIYYGISVPAHSFSNVG